MVVNNEGTLLEASEEGAVRHHKAAANRRTNSSLSIPLPVEEVAASNCKSISPSEGKAVVLNHDEGNSSSDDGASSSSGSEAYLGKVSRKTHRKMKRSLGSGFELVELSQPSVDHPHPIVLQLGPAPPQSLDPSAPSCSHTSYGSRSPPGSKGSPGGATVVTVATSRESMGSASSIVLVEDELPPEEQWRDGLLGGFCFGGSLCATGLPSLCCTTAALFKVVRALGWHPGKCRQFLALTLITLLWASIPLAVYLHIYPVAGAALLLVLTLEAAAAWRLRGVVRRRFNIDGSACGDGALSCLFTSCVAAQMLRHLRPRTRAASATTGTMSASGSSHHIVGVGV